MIKIGQFYYDIKYTLSLDVKLEILVK